MESLEGGKRRDYDGIEYIALFVAGLFAVTSVVVAAVCYYCLVHWCTWLW